MTRENERLGFGTRRKRKHKKKIQAYINNFFSPAFFVLLNIFYEIIFHTYYYKNLNIIIPVLLAIPTGILAGVFCDLFPNKVTKILRYIFSVIAFLIFGTQIVYSYIFKDIMTWSMVGLAKQVVEGFLGETFFGIWKTLPILILLALPIVALIILDKKLCPINRPNPFKAVLVLVVFLISEGIALVAIAIPGKNAHTPYDIYHKNWKLDLSAEKLGIVCSTWMDLKTTLFGSDENEPGPVIVTLPVEETTADNTETNIGTESSHGNEPPENPYNTIEDLDFATMANATNDQTLKNLCDYLSKVQPTKKNKYTGMFEGYNLITICCESFSPMVVDEKYTPTLYKLVNTGFVFDNFWTPYSSVTTNGEYSFLTGMYPDFNKPKADGSFLFSANNTMNMTMTSWFKGHGVQSLAYHANKLSCYNRDITHTNLGYIIKGQGDYDNLVGWPESDYVLLQDSMGEYVNNDCFHVHIMSVSMHHNYLFETNSMAAKNKDIVMKITPEELIPNLPTSYKNLADGEDYKSILENARAYYACTIEFDRALEYMLSELEKAGQLEKTVIVIATDHYPYGLSDTGHAAMMGYKSRYSLKYDGLERYKSNLVIWNSQLETKHISKACCTVDILPTLLNLFGYEYDSRLYSGQDIFSDSYGLAVIKDQSFITDKIVYNSRYNKVYYLDSSWTMPDGYIDAFIQICSNRFSVASNVLNYDFFSLLSKNVLEESWKK